VREGDDDPLAGADERTKLVLGLCEPACSERRSLGLERKRLIRGKRVELSRAGEVRFDVQLLQ